MLESCIVIYPERILDDGLSICLCIKIHALTYFLDKNATIIHLNFQCFW